MNKVKLLMVNPTSNHIGWMNKTVVGITEVGKIGYVVEAPFNSDRLEFVSREEYILVHPTADNEVEILRKKVYQYETMITKLLNYPDLIVISAIRNELEHIRNGDYEK